MASHPSTSVSVRRVRFVCVVALSALGMSACLGWITGWRVLASARPMYIPMSPNTALSFVVMAIALGSMASGRGRVAPPATCAAMVVLVAGARLFEILTGLDLSVDSWFFRVPKESLGLAPVGQMSIFSAVLFVTSSLTVFLLLVRGGTRWGRDVAGIFGLAVVASGSIFLLGYMFDAPLLYGGRTIPMALNTASAFVFLGTGIVFQAGADAFPLVSLRGPSVHRRLLRAFLPFSMAKVFVVAWLIHLVTINVGDSAAALMSALAAVLTMLVSALICGRIARRVGGQLERAELELIRAQEGLEVRVAERTRELRLAKELLEERNRQLQQSALELETTAASVREAHEELQSAHHELKRAESQLVQSETLSAMGKMVAGVAHEINNPLAFVTNNVAVLQRDVGHLQRLLCLYQEAEGTLAIHQNELSRRIHELAEQIDLTYVLDHLAGMMVQSRDGLKRIQQIVKGLRDFARVDESDLKEVDLNDGITSTVEIMRPMAIQQRVALETDLEPLPRVTCFAAKINQVVLNLVVNAIDASPQGALVTVRTRPAAIGVAIEVVDEGSGIPPAILDRIFDPFFTTKPIGKGTGLGLSISYGIVQSHGGRIDVESTPGKGSRFSIYLPIKAQPPSSGRADGATTGAGLPRPGIDDGEGAGDGASFASDAIEQSRQHAGRVRDGLA